MPAKNTMRYFLINFLCILMPLIFASFFVTHMLMVQMQEKEKEKLNIQLNEILTVLREDFLDFKSKSIALFANKEFDSKQVVHNHQGAKTAIRLISSLKQFDREAEDITIYYGEEFLYSASGRVSPETYYSVTMSCDKKSTELAVQALKSSEMEVNVLYKRNGDGYLTYHIPVGMDYMGYSRSVEILNSFSGMGRRFGDCLQNVGVLIELGIAGDKIYFHNTQSGCHIVSSENVDTLLVRYENDFLEDNISDLDISIKLLFDMKEQLAGFYDIRNFYTALLIIGLLLSLVMSFWLSRKRNLRINELVNNIKSNNVVRQFGSKWLTNEFDYIQLLLNEAIEEDKMVRSKVRMYRQMLLQQLSMMVFHGVLREKEEIQTVLKICEAELYEEYFYILGVKVDNQDIKQLEGVLQGDMYCVEYKKEIANVFVLCELSNIDPDMKMRHKIGVRFLDEMENLGILCGQVVTSQVYDQIAMANCAYLEAVSLLNNTNTNHEKVTCWESLIQNKEGFGAAIKSTAFNLFREAIKQRNEHQASVMLKRIMQQNLRGQEKCEEIQHMRYMITQELLLAIRASDDIEDEQQLLIEIADINQNDEALFENKVLSILERYCRKTTDSDNFDSIIKYVKANYTNFDFSLDKVADYAGVSRSQMSKIFQARIGMGYIEYVTLLRMEKAKELLAQTNMSVKEIFEKVGYMDVTNASRKFNAAYGVKPSVYRGQIKKGKDGIREKENDCNDLREK